MLRLLLKINEHKYWHGKHYVEDDIRTITVMKCNPSVENKYLDIKKKL